MPDFLFALPLTHRLLNNWPHDPLQIRQERARVPFAESSHTSVPQALIALPTRIPGDGEWTGRIRLPRGRKEPTQLLRGDLPSKLGG